MVHSNEALMVWTASHKPFIFMLVVFVNFVVVVVDVGGGGVVCYVS